MSTDSTPCGCPFCEPEVFVNNHEDWITELLLEPGVHGEVLTTLCMTLLMKETGYTEKDQVKADIETALGQEDEPCHDLSPGTSAKLRRLVNDQRTDFVRLLCSENRTLRAIALVMLLNADQYDGARILEDVEMFYEFQKETPEGRSSIE